MAITLVTHVVDDVWDGAAAWLQEHSTHPEIVVTAGRDHFRREVSIHVACMACDHVWDSTMSYRTQFGLNPAEAMKNWIGPFMRRICAVPCFKLTLLAELAEWITERVLQAGYFGVEYSELLEEAVRDHLCAPSDVDVVLEKLGFVRDGAPGHLFVPSSVALDQKIDVRMVGSSIVPAGPRIRLPEDHPLHPGNSHNCDLPPLFGGETIEWEDE